jgi:hypothetical protein
MSLTFKASSSQVEEGRVLTGEDMCLLQGILDKIWRTHFREKNIKKRKLTFGEFSVIWELSRSCDHVDTLPGSSTEHLVNGFEVQTFLVLDNSASASGLSWVGSCGSGKGSLGLA